MDSSSLLFNFSKSVVEGLDMAPCEDMIDMERFFKPEERLFFEK